jgi:adenylate kinase
MKKTKSVVIFFGPPGSGKGTQSDMLGEHLRLPVISPGELLRHEREKKTVIGLAAEERMANGKLLPDSLVEEVLLKRLAKKDTAKGFVLDGFPRRLPQLRKLAKMLKELGVDDESITAVYVRVRDAQVKKRISGRRVCDCGAAYHLVHNPSKKVGVCDLCGRKLQIRQDDKPQIIKDRLKTFHELNIPMLDYFRKRGRLFTVDGEEPIDDVHENIKAIIDNKL